jgi:hypothetical protein
MAPPHRFQHAPPRPLLFNVLVAARAVHANLVPEKLARSTRAVCPGPIALYFLQFFRTGLLTRQRSIRYK